MTCFTAQAISLPSLRTAEQTANLAALISSVVPFFHDRHRSSVHAPFVAQLDEQRGGTDDCEHNASSDHGSKSKMDVHRNSPI